LGCYHCGKPGHLARDCKTDMGATVCYECGKPGHMARDCKGSVPGPAVAMNAAPFLDNACFACGKAGHLARDCKNKPAVARGTRVFIGNLSFETTWQDLKSHVRSAINVNVVHCDVLTQPTGKSKGCAIVEFETVEDAERAVTQLTDTELKGRKIYVREDREEKGFGVRPAPGFGPGVNMGGVAPQTQGFTQPQQPASGDRRGCQLYIGNLPFNTAWQDLKDMFSEYGDVVRADVMEDRVTQRSKGYGLVRYNNPQAAQAAIEALHDCDLQGRKIVVRLDEFA